MPDPTDVTLLRNAIEASGLSARRFATQVLGVDERTTRYWLAGERPIPETTRRLLVAGLRDARLWRALESAATE